MVNYTAFYTCGDIPSYASYRAQYIWYDQQLSAAISIVVTTVYTFLSIWDVATSCGYGWSIGWSIIMVV